MSAIIIIPLYIIVNYYENKKQHKKDDIVNTKLYQKYSIAKKKIDRMKLTNKSTVMHYE